jgi:hypothetical protein
MLLNTAYFYLGAYLRKSEIVVHYGAIQFTHRIVHNELQSKVIRSQLRRKLQGKFKLLPVDRRLHSFE